MKNFVYDIETYINFFCAVFRSKDEYLVFEISPRKDESRKLYKFLKSKEINYLIGFNTIRFDMQVLQYFLDGISKYKDLKGAEIAELLYHYGQDVIASGDEDNVFPPTREYDLHIPQIDLYKVMHIGNKARMCSLKWMEFTLRWDKVQDLPYKHDTVLHDNQFDEIIKYCKNDVDFTHYLAKTRSNDIKLRLQLINKFDNPMLMNYDDVKIGEYINRITYCELTNKEFKSFRHQKSIQKKFFVNEIVNPIIKFKTKELQDWYEELKTMSFLDTDDSFHSSVEIGDLTLSFMKGGIHSEDPARRVIRKPGWYLTEEDVGGMYPATLINHYYYPRHLGEEWVIGLKQNFDYRNNQLKPRMKKLQKFSPEWQSLNSEQLAYKLSLNGGGYGKLGNFYSWQYDPLQKYKVTFFGQLSLMMLMETMHLAGVTLISANTDGIVINYPEELRPTVEKINKAWEKKTRYILEETHYKEIIQTNVNNYIAVITDENYKDTLNIKHKGAAFVMDIDQEPWKNNSKRIVPIALKEYFINGVDYKDVICHGPGYEFENSKGQKEKTTIYDYCLGIKITKKQKAFIENSITKNKDYITDKVFRYYILDDFEEYPTLYREYIDGKAKGNIIAVQKGYPIQPFMQYEEKDDYNILYQYYINEIEKIIKPILHHNRVGKQTTMF